LKLFLFFSKLSIAKNSVMGPNNSDTATTPARKNLCDVKVTYKEGL
jgi:hypothetical protein